MDTDRTGLLIIRAWLEHGSVEPLRARVRLTTDVSAGFEQELAFADVHAVSVAVEAWLEDLLAGGATPAEKKTGA